MRTEYRLILIVTVMLVALMTATVVNVGVNFREYAYQNAIEKSRMTAAIVRDGLTAHMVNGMMDKRDFFLRNIANAKDVKALWIVRSPEVVKQFGKGMLNESSRDAIDEQVLKSGEEVRKIVEDQKSATLRVTIPYKASAYSNPNCLQCHQVSEDTVLGAVSMEFDISDTREAGVMTMLKIIGINILFILIALWLTRHFSKPYMELFANMRKGIAHARRGDFSFRFSTKITSGEGAELTEQMNTLFTKMQETFSEIKDSLVSFMGPVKISCDDPLNEAREIISELAHVYKFKKTVELDATKEEIYGRLVRVLNERFGMHHLALYEVNKVNKERQLVYVSDGLKSFCSSASEDDALLCRAFRTDSSVVSVDFPQICPSCERDDIHYMCLPFDIDEKFSLVLSASAKEAEEVEAWRSKIGNINTYFAEAKPVIESKVLMHQLEEASLHDGLTGLYNRRFLEGMIEKLAAQVKRNNSSLAILMIDIDFFKMVNDEYGHDVGDNAIRLLAEVLKNSIRESDLAIRYGGEEFLVLLHNASEEGAVQVAEKIRQTFASTEIATGNGAIKKTLSVGVACYPKDGETIWQVVKFADTALYKAKNSGRNKVVVFQKEMYNDDAY